MIKTNPPYQTGLDQVHGSASITHHNDFTKVIAGKSKIIKKDSHVKVLVLFALWLNDIRYISVFLPDWARIVPDT
jgi:hypothetical protein